MRGGPGGVVLASGVGVLAQNAISAQRDQHRYDEEYPGLCWLDGEEEEQADAEDGDQKRYS